MADIHEKIQNMLDEIPEFDHTDHRREYTMSKQSARWMANMMLMITESSGCNSGFTPEEAQALKTMASERKKLLAALGAVVLAVLVYFGQMLLKLMDIDFWKKLFS